MRLTDRTKREEPKSLIEMNDTDLQKAYQTTQLRLKEARERMEFLYINDLHEDLMKIKREWKSRQLQVERKAVI